MQLTTEERMALEIYGASDKVTINDVARECDFSVREAGEVVANLQELGLLAGGRERKITENGRCFLEGRDIPLEGVAAPAVVEKEGSGRGETRMLTDVLAEQYHIKPVDLYNIVAKNIIHVGPGESLPSTAEVYHVMTTMARYDLDPWMKQIHAFRHKGKLQVMMGYDGWVQKANQYPGYVGTKYKYSEDEVDVPGVHGKKCWKWVECTVYSKERTPTVVRAYFDEWYVPNGNWKQYTRNRLRQKAFTMAVREHCGIAMWDEADREQFQYHETSAEIISEKTSERKDAMAAKLGAVPVGVVDPEDHDSDVQLMVEGLTTDQEGLL